MTDTGSRWRAVTGHRLFWPVAVLVVMLAANTIYRPGFLSVEVTDGHLYGTPIDILRLSAPLILVALGMTVVISTGGIDLSVGSVCAISGALACSYISQQADQNSFPVVLTALAMGLGIALVLGAWNGVLVAVIGIQPIIATLILMVAGRGLAQLITEGQIIPSTPSRTGDRAGSCADPAAGRLIALAAAVLSPRSPRRTALGMIIERWRQRRGHRLADPLGPGVFLAYLLSAACAAVAGFMMTANVSSADGQRRRAVGGARRHPRGGHRWHRPCRGPFYLSAPSSAR